MRTHHRPACAASVLLAAALVTLAGCTSNPVRPVPDPAGPTGPASAAPPSPAAPESFPVDIPCDQLIPADVLAAFDPEAVADPAYAPAGPAAAMVGWQGVACGWVDTANGSTIEIAVARLGAENLEAVQNELVLTTPTVPTYGGVDYFRFDGESGEVNAFTGDAWIFSRGSEFFEPGDATELIRAAKAGLG
ncbi:MAG: hypothetical protein JWP66_1727 [Naasia sp.]|nr:hypothetical protein [Naasia sp.]